jgi:DNA replication ATP-dependent helicase Dna2
MSEALVMGCMLHEVLQACLTGQGLLDDSLVPDFDETSLQPFFDMPFPLHWYGPGRTNFSLPFLVKQVKLQVLHNLDGLLCCGMETSAAEAKLLDLCRPFGEFSKRYLEDTLAVTRAENGNSADALQGLFRGVNGMLETASAFKEDATVLDSRTTVPTLARVTHVFDVEEEIWSPMYGLKGKMDVSVEVELQETEVERPAWRGGNHFVPGQQQRAGTGPSAQQPPQRGAQGGSFYRRTQSTPTTGPVRRSAMNRYSSIMPMEIKTGRSVDALEHRAQTMLYTLMMSDRYGTNVDSGLLYYTRSGDMHRVRRTRNEVRGLIVGRNELAFWMKRDSKDEEEIGDQRRIALARANGGDAAQELQEADEGNTALPPTIDNERECNRCFVQDGCMLYRRTIDRIVEDEENPSEISQLYSRITSHLTSSQAAFYQKWERLLSLEEEDMVKFKRELWTLTAAAREEVGRCFANMIMEPRQPDIGAGTSSGEVHSHTYRFVRKPMAGSPGQMLLGGSISAGDPCVISIEPGMFSVAQGYIVEVSSHFVTIGIDHHLDAILERAAVEQGKDPGDVSNLDITFRIDRDEYSDGMAKIRFQLSRLFFSTSERDHRHRELIVDLEAPRFDESVQLRDEDLPSHLNEDQRAAMRRVLAAEDYALILGMPGTGKTTTIAELIKLLVARGKTILLASYTHSAVDTILRKLLDAPAVRLLRLGNVDRVHDDLQGHTLPKVSSVEELDVVLNTPNVIATTCLSTGHATFARRKFDYCIVDEASQITLPTCLGPLRFADKFVLVGDHFQLPPLVRNTTARSGGLDISLFKRLSDAHNEAVVYLTRQYRMNETIMMLSNHLIYDGLLKCGNEEVAKQVLHLPHHERAIALLHAKAAPSSQKSHTSPDGTAGPPSCKAEAGADGKQQHCWLEQLLDPSCTAVFVDTDDVPGTETRRGRMVQNNVEAGVIQQLARSLVLGGVPAGDIAVITPYRQQLKLLQNLLLPPRLAQAVTTSRQSAAAIKREMEREGGAGAGGEIEILTADRSQGRDKPVVLISLVRSNDLGARGVGELLNDWRRINVALTRAQRKVVIVGSQKTLSAAPLLEDFFGLMREQGCIQKLPKGALEMHPIASTEPGREIPPALSQEVDRKVQESKKSALVKDEELDDGSFSRPAARGFVSTSPHSSQEKHHSGRALEELQPLSQSSQNGNKVTDYKGDDDSIDEIEADWGPVPSRVLGKRKERSLNGSQQQRLSEEDKEQHPPSPDRSQELVKNLASSSKPALQDGMARRQAAAIAKGEALLKSRPIIRDAILASQED